MFADWADWVTGLIDEAPDARTRELLILAAAREADGEYIWHQHVPMALDAGVTREEILGVSDGTYDAFPPAERTLLAYVVAVVDRSVDDSVHEGVTSHYDESTLLTLLTLASEYHRLATVMDALALDTEAPFIGWHLENH